MHQHIGVDDEDHKGRQQEKGDERRFDIKKGQFDGAFQQNIFMGHGVHCNREVRQK
jgi:hypothetical protein